jgi:hypothetical protein
MTPGNESAALTLEKVRERLVKTNMVIFRKGRHEFIIVQICNKGIEIKTLNTSE